MSPSPVFPSSSLGATLLLGGVVFALTNADGLLLLTFFFGHGRRHRGRVVIGGCAGFSAIVGLGLFGRLAAKLISPQHIGWLGVLPIALGLHQLWQTRAGRPQPSEASHLSILRVATVIFASGADNIAVYIPLFAASSRRALLALLAAFGAGVAVWCALGYYLGSRQLLQASVRRFGPRLSAAVLIGLGIYILWSSGTFRGTG